jgi:ketosteroid isomerase-like protein
LETALDLLGRYHQAMLDKSADDLADLYAEDALHEFPFTHGDGAVLRGREAIRARYTAVWGRMPFELVAVENLVTHPMTDPDMLVAEQDLRVRDTATGAVFVASFVLVMTVRGGQIVRLRDYTDDLTFARATGRAR